LKALILMTVDPHKIAKGHWGTVFDLGNGRVLKQFREDAHPKAVKMEAEVAHLANKLGVATPRPISVQTDVGQCAIVFEKIDGETLAQHILPRPWKLIWGTREMARILAKIHTIQINGTQPFKCALEESIQSLSELPENKKIKALEILKSLPDGDRLCHKDYHPGNVMVAGSSCFVIDWGGATHGHPMADLTYTYVLNQVDGVSEDFPWINRVFIRAMRGIYVELFLYFYARYSGVKYRMLKAEIKRWVIPVAAARLASYGDFETRALLKILRSNGLR